MRIITHTKQVQKSRASKGTSDRLQEKKNTRVRQITGMGIIKERQKKKKKKEHCKER